MQKYYDKIREIEQDCGVKIDFGCIIGTLTCKFGKQNGFVFYMLAMSLENNYFFKVENGVVTFSAQIIKDLVDNE